MRNFCPSYKIFRKYFSKSTNRDLQLLLTSKKLKLVDAFLMSNVLSANVKVVSVILIQFPVENVKISF